MRGKHVSTPMEDLVKQAKGLVKNGVKELILIAQDLTFYGLDIYKERKLSDLLKNLSDIEGLDWIRLQYAYPSGFPLDVLDVMRERDNICNYLDMPLQHGTTKMLQAMRRGITREKTDELIATIRDRVPNIALRTTLITGFPGETRDDFAELMNWVETTRFDRLGVFTYSHEENTHAYTMKDDVPAREKKKRADQIMEVQSEISLMKNQEKLGQELKVLIDRVEGQYYIGRTEFDSPEVDNEVIIHSLDQYLRIGDFVKVKVVNAENYDLVGSLI
jgi:ribosomal protein S12 methylthiotransferase